MQSIQFSCQILMKFEFSRHILEKSSDAKFHENPSSGSLAVSCGLKDRQTEGRTELTKLLVAFRNFCENTKTYNMKTIQKKTFRSSEADSDGTRDVAHVV
jgi:hypothetical protein